jgi:hypothetical protein
MYLYYECQLSTCNYFTSGMHKKSLEASKKIREEEGCTDRTENKDFSQLKDLIFILSRTKLCILGNWF